MSQITTPAVASTLPREPSLCQPVGTPKPVKRSRLHWFRQRLALKIMWFVTNRNRPRLYSALTPIRLGWAYLYDARRFSRAAHLTDPFKNRQTAQAHLLRAAHGLEKGQALSSPRPGFGSAKIKDLIACTARYQALFGCDEISRASIGVLRGIQRFHSRTGHAAPEWEAALRGLEESEAKNAAAAVCEIPSVRMSRSEVLAALPADPEAFFRRRCSIRQFQAGPIERSLLERAVRFAQKTPSVCNRQCSRVRIYTDQADMADVLRHQDGNSGFGHEAGAVMVVTADLSCFYKEAERNQAFVDGGMFAVSLVYALHSVGLGSCLLNWSRGPYDDAELRRKLEIPDNEVVITMLVAGNLRENFMVAASPRRPIEDVLRWSTLGRA